MSTARTVVLLVATLVFALALRWPQLSVDPAPEPGGAPSPETAAAEGPPTLAPPPPWLLPLDDSYIFIRYAQQLARGRVLEWSDGESSSGASSLLYPLLLVPGQLLFDDLAGWSWWSFGLGAVGVFCLALAGARLLHLVGLPPPWPLAGGLVLIVWGPAAWAALAGMDSAFGAAALLAACGLWIECTRVDEPPRGRRVALLVLLALLPWIRPDFAAVVGLTALAIVCGAGPAPRRVAFLLPLPGAAWAAWNLATTGHLSPSGVLAKSTLSAPFLHFGERVELVWGVLSRGLGRLYVGAEPMALPAPVGLLAVATAAAVGVAAVAPTVLPLRGAQRATLDALRPLVVVWLAALAASSFSGFLPWQHYRHHHPGLACAWLLALAGLHVALSTAFGDASSRRLQRLMRWLPLAIPLLLVLRLPAWAYDYFRTAVLLHQDNAAVAAFLEQRDTDDDVLLVHDAGYLQLVHDGPAIDVMGLGTTALALPYRDGSGAVAEALARRPRRPTLAAGRPSLLQPQPLLAPPLFVAPSRAYSRDPMLVAPVRAALFDGTVLEREPAVRRNARLLGVDFAHAPSEADADLDWRPPPVPSAAGPALALESATGAGEVLHGCRPLRGALSIELPTGGDRLHLRWAPAPDADARLTVAALSADRQDANAEIETTLLITKREASGERWDELALALPPRAVRLELTADGDAAPCLESLVVFGRAGRP
ncbi:MAG: hypothetical protein AAGC60_29945 [Acidobacteriota bacterium]